MINANVLPIFGISNISRNIPPTMLFTHVINPPVIPSAIGYAVSHASSKNNGFDPFIAIVRMIEAAQR